MSKNFWVIVFLSCVFCVPSVRAEAPSQPTIVVEQIPGKSNKQISFSVSIVNPTKEPLEIKTDYSDLINYRLGNYDWNKESQVLFLKSNYNIAPGEKKMIRTFQHDLKHFPSPESDQAAVIVEVKGVGTVTQVFELEKPGFFEGLMDKLLNPSTKNTPLRQAQGEPIRQSQGEQNASTLSSSPQASGGDQESESPQNSSTDDLSTDTEQILTAPQSSVPSPSPQNLGGDPVTPIDEQPELAQEPEPVAPVSTPLGLPADTTPPEMPTIQSVPQATVESDLTLSGTKDANASLWINGAESVVINNQTAWSAPVPLNEGTNLLNIESRDASGNVSPAVTISIIRDSMPPQMDSLNVSAITTDSASINLTANEGVSATLTYEKADSNNPLSVVSVTRQNSHTFNLNNLDAQSDYTFFVTVQDLVAHSATSATLSFTTAAATGPFQDPVPLNLTVLPLVGNYMQGYEELADLNNDGVNELISVEQELAIGLYVAYSAPDGSYPVTSHFAAASIEDAFPLLYYKIGDLNGDTITDIALVTDEWIGSWYTRNRTLLFLSQWNQAQTRFEYQFVQSVDQPVWTNLRPLVLGDFNGDAVKDLVILESIAAGVHYFRMILSDLQTQRYGLQANGIRIGIPLGADDIILPVAAADLNGDGLDELIVHKRQIAATNNVALVAISSPSFSPSPQQSLLNFSYRGVYEMALFGDADNNGNDDLVVTGLYPPVAGALAGTPFRRIIKLMPAPAAAQFHNVDAGTNVNALTIIGDVNGDGRRDLALVPPTTDNANQEIRIYRGNTAGFDMTSPEFVIPIEQSEVADPGPVRKVSTRSRQVGSQTKYDLLVEIRSQSDSAQIVHLLYAAQ